jgi:hypothetical protein
MTAKTSNRDKSLSLSRRNFMRGSAVVGGQSLLLPASQAAATSLEGYTGSASVALGATLDFFLRDPQAVGNGTTVYPLTITRVGFPDTAVLTTTATIGNQVVPADATVNGCRWARTFQLSVPASWKSGLYFAFIGSGPNACTVPFVVRAAGSTAGVKTLVQIQVSTAHAYNAYGGKSLYDYNSSNGLRSPKVSLDRPFTESFNSFFDVYAQYLVRWLAKNNIAADFCTDIDIVANPAILNPYQLFVDVGHDEYWTLGRRQTMDAFVARGGNAAYLGANTSWFQSRLEAGPSGANRSLVCYKDAAADPIADPAQKTINFVSLTPPNPENRTTGLGYLTGCSWTGAQPRPVTPSVVMRDEHWAFAGTGLARNAGFGGAYIGYECDSASFVRGGLDQRPYPTGADDAPETLRILALADGSNWNALSLAAGGAGEQSGYSMISVFSRGGGAGTVFNAGTVEWAYGLIPELNGQTATPISRITLNVITKLAAPWSESADVRQFRKPLSGVQANYYYGLATAAPAGSQMLLDGFVFRAFASAGSGTAPIYRYRSKTPGSTGTRYRYSTSSALDPSAAAWVLEGVAFHAYAAPRSDAVAVYEHTLLNAALQELLATYSTLATPPSGWTAGPVVFHAPNDSAGTPTPTPGFTLAAAAPALAVVRGQSVATAISVAAINGFNRAVAFSASGLPAGVTASVSPASSTSGTTLTLAAGSSALAGSSTVIVTGTAAATATQPAVTAMTMVTLSVSVPTPAPSFTLSATPSALLLLLGGILGGSVAVAIGRVNGFSAAVSFSVTGLPSGMRASFASSSGGATMSLTATSLLGAQRGFFTLRITGTAGSLTATDTVNLTVL